MASSIADFRARLYQEITLPSGLVAQIRKVQAWDFLGLGELPVPSPAAQEGSIPNQDEFESMKRYTDRALLRGVVQPRLSDEVDADGEPVYRPDRLHVSELEPGDYGALSTAIFAWAGLTQEDGQAIEAFRHDAVGASGESAGGAVPLSAE